MGYRLYHLVKYDIEVGSEVGENYRQDEIIDLFEKINELYDINVVTYYDSPQLIELEISKNQFMKFLKKMNQDEFDEDELDLIDQFTDCIKADKNNKDIVRFESF